MPALFFAVALSACLQAPFEQPAIAVIVDDLGNRPQHDYAALAVPQLRSFAILPHAPFTAQLAEAVHQAGKEVLLHLPMEATQNNHLLGPGALRASMAYDEFIQTLHQALDAVPHRIGLNNHMGSLLSQDKRRMAWLMEELGSHTNLIYVDSRTISHSAAGSAARAARVPYLARDVFLDNRRDADYIHAQFDELIDRALSHGEAIGIAHPHPETLAVLRQRLAKLAPVRLLAVADLLRERECRAGKASLQPGLSASTAQRDQRSSHAETANHPHAQR